MSDVMEIVRFQLVDAAGAAEALAGVQAWLAAQPGFCARVVVGPDAEGVFTDLVRWRSLDDAQAAMAAMEQSPAALAFMARIDPASVQMSHLPVALG